MTEPTPVTEDAHATAPELLARAAADYDDSQAAVQAHEDQGGTGERQGVLPGGSG